MILRSKFPKASESRFVRFVREDFNGREPWILVGALSDRELAERGALLAGPRIDRDALREDGLDGELVWLLDEEGMRALPRERREARLHELLVKCSRSIELPPIDLDVSETGTREDALAWAARLAPALERVGLGVASWHTTGGRAGIHGDLEAPPSFAHPDLVEIARVLVIEAARSVGIPLLSDHPEKAGRAPVVLDDRLFRRTPESRGLVWRLSGALKPKSGGFKTPINLLGEPIDYARPTPGPVEAFERAATVVARQRELEGSGGPRRPRRARPPLALPPSLTCLTRFADVLARLLVAGDRHEPRLAVAGWLIGTLRIADSIVEATLARATGDAEDARDAVSSTRRRVDANLRCMGLPTLQQKFGGAACVELREALEKDGVTAARKTYWTDPERRFLMRLSRAVPHDFKGRLALVGGARCGTFSMPYECEDHGVQGVRTNVEERELTCPHCREARLAARLEILREQLKKETYGVLVVRCDTDVEDRIAAPKAARRGGKLLVWNGWRWFLGHDHVLFVMAACDAPGIRDRIAKLRAAAVEDLERGDARARQAAFDFDVQPEDARQVSKAELLELVARAWRQPGVQLQGLIEVGDEERALAFPWLQRTNVVRTHADKSGAELLHWPSAKAIRERAKAKAIAARGGIDPTLCDAEAGLDELGQPIPCCKPYNVHVDHLPTGVRLREEPYVGRFPQKHELHLLLEIADPDVLKAGYEQQRALARRR